MQAPDAPATESDLRSFASAMPFAETTPGPGRKLSYLVGGKSFVVFRNPRKDAFDPGTGELYPDVVIFWVDGEDAKQSLVQDPGTPFFTTDHFDGYPAVLLRLSRIGELTRRELAEVVEDAWLSRVSARRARQYLDGPDRITG